MKKHILYIYFLFLFVPILTPRVWATTPDAGTQNVLDEASEYILSRIQSLRTNPWFEAESLGLNVTLLRRESIPLDMAIKWDAGLWPMLLSDRLSEAANLHCEEMLSQGYFDLISPDGTTPDDRVLAQEYQADKTFEIIRAIAFNVYLSPIEAAEEIVNALFKDSLQSSANSELTPLLMDEFMEIGIGLKGGDITVDNRIYHVYVTSIFIAIPRLSQNEWIQCGYLYDDLNENGFYNQGEGVSYTALGVDRNGVPGDDEDKILATTSANGSYCFRIPKGQFNIAILGQLTTGSTPPYSVGTSGGIIRRDYVIKSNNIDGIPDSH